MKCGITIQGDVLLDILGVDHAAVAKRDSHLLGIEIGLAQRKDLSVFVNCLRIKKIFADRAFDNVLVNDPLGSLGRCLGIESAFRINDNDRAECAKSKAACLNDKNICKSFRFDLFLERVANFVASGGSTSGMSFSYVIVMAYTSS